jgi:uncharacterized protein YebE (UPF0316 family)
MNFLSEPIYIYIIIFVVKIIEVTMATIRIVLVTKGERIKGAMIGLVEVVIWALLVSQVLANLTEDPFKLVVYALGFSIGTFSGSFFEQKLGFGSVRVEIIVKESSGKELGKALRTKGFAVTEVVGQGMNHPRSVLIMHIKRKRSAEAINLIKQLEHNAVITINDVKPVYGGYGILKK